MSLIPRHIQVTESDLASSQPGGRFFLLPGSPGRAARIAERFSHRAVFPSDRGHDVHIGTIDGDSGSIDVGVVSTGMGCPSLDIIVSELIALGIRRLLRVGTAGSLQPHTVRTPHLIIATAAVRDEGTSLAYAPPEVPAVASRQLVTAAETAARRLFPADAVHVGMVQTKDSLYGREFLSGPLKVENRRYLEMVATLGVLATEMETAHLFILAQVHSACEDATVGNASRLLSDPILAGSVLAILGDDTPFSGDAATQAEAVTRVVDLAFATVKEFYRVSAPPAQPTGGIS